MNPPRPVPPAPGQIGFPRPRLSRRDRLIGGGLRLLAALKAARWLGAPAAGVIVTLHHVRPARGADFDPLSHLSVTPEFLDRFLSEMARAGWRFVTPTELLEPAGAGALRRMAVTLDDGYRDNSEHAAPVFRRHGCPFTIYVTPGFCDRSAEIWWEAITLVIARADRMEAEPGGPPALVTRTADQKDAAFRIWVDYLAGSVDETQQRQLIRRLCDRHGVDLRALAADLVMDWDEVRAIARDPLCTIGAHTMTHPALKRLPEPEARREMRESADRIEQETGTRPTTLAFPYGYSTAAGPREARLAAEEGFVASFTTRPGCVPLGRAGHGLPRISLNGNYQDVRLYPALFAPNLWRLAGWLKKSGIRRGHPPAAPSTGSPHPQV
ncbi:polysaccharide deacetylase family protein [Faunimonas sp. B44]|uniref:polysaccharide deacetylase family protein n=1 Tax=Faunimonas sp. B44 TaxID=3461493 RepID=UPI00404403C7